MEVKEIVKEIIECNKLSQMKLAKILNVSQKAISNWLSGVDVPNVRNVMTIYEKFGITPNEFLGLEEPKNFKLDTKE